VRFSKRTLRRSSSWRTEWLSADGVTPSRNAAARKLSSSATAMNAGQIGKVTAMGHS
jgi:hypothetical protein